MRVFIVIAILIATLVVSIYQINYVISNNAPECLLDRDMVTCVTLKINGR